MIMFIHVFMNKIGIDASDYFMIFYDLTYFNVFVMRYYAIGISIN